MARRLEVTARRTLPGRPVSGDTPKADYDVATAFSGDDELVPLRIRVAAGALMVMLAQPVSWAETASAAAIAARRKNEVMVSP